MCNLYPHQGEQPVETQEIPSPEEAARLLIDLMRASGDIENRAAELVGRMPNDPYFLKNTLYTLLLAEERSAQDHAMASRGGRYKRLTGNPGEPDFVKDIVTGIVAPLKNNRKETGLQE